MNTAGRLATRQVRFKKHMWRENEVNKTLSQRARLLRGEGGRWQYVSATDLTPNAVGRYIE